jgi:hypothetical protein
VISNVIAQDGLSEAKPTVEYLASRPGYQPDVADAGRRVSPELTCGD